MLFSFFDQHFFCIRLSLELLPVLEPLERYMTPTLDVALLSSSRAGADLGQTSNVESVIITRLSQSLYFNS